ncbi:MAG: hypothetical protein ACM3ST_14200 [Bdellovibrio bacteriovorus]
MAKGILVAACLWGALAIPASAAFATDGAIRGIGPAATTVTALASAVERLVERSKPAEWALRRACLYYAFAGQHLLLQRGIVASVWVGAVVYDPETAASHEIWPHAWLETATHFIDYAALPRWGEVRVIPHHLVARSPSEVRPGVTRVLALQRVEDLDLVTYLAAHRARFDRIVQGEH